MKPRSQLLHPVIHSLISYHHPFHKCHPLRVSRMNAITKFWIRERICTMCGTTASHVGRWAFIVLQHNASTISSFCCVLLLSCLVFVLSGLGRLLMHNLWRVVLVSFFLLPFSCTSSKDMHFVMQLLVGAGIKSSTYDEHWIRMCIFNNPVQLIINLSISDHNLFQWLR